MHEEHSGTLNEGWNELLPPPSLVQIIILSMHIYTSDGRLYNFNQI